VEFNQFSHLIFKDISMAVKGNKKEHEAAEVDRLWDELDRMRLQELTLFETEVEAEDNTAQADDAERLCEQLTARIKARKEALKELKENSSTQETLDSQEEEDKQSELQWLESDYTLAQRSGNETTQALKIQLEHEKKSRQAIDNKVKACMAERQKQMGLKADEEMQLLSQLEQAESELAQASRDGKYYEELIASFLASLAPDVEELLKERRGESMTSEARRPKWAEESDLLVEAGGVRAGSKRIYYRDGKSHLKNSRPPTAEAAVLPRPPSTGFGSGSRRSSIMGSR